MTRRKNITEVTKWLRRKDADLKYVKLEWKQRPILTITKTTSPQTEVVRIPKSCILTDKVVHTSPGIVPLLAILKKREHKLAHRLSLWAVFLLQTLSDPHSDWFCYINALPKVHSDIPLMWKTGHQDLLAGTLTYEVLQGNLEVYYRDYTVLRLVCRIPFEFQDYLWAIITATRGIFRLPVGGQAQGAMVPGLGDLGRTSAINTKWHYDVPSETMVVQASKWLTKGSQLTMGCSSKGNSILANSYGFIVPDNPKTETLLSVPLHDIRPTETDEIRQLKYDLLGRRQNYDNGAARFEIRNKAINSVVDQPIIHFQIARPTIHDYALKTPFVFLLGTLRVLFLDTCPTDMEPSQFAQAPTQFIDIQNERRVFQYLSTACECKLGKLGIARRIANESKTQPDTPSLISQIFDSEFGLMEEISRMCHSISMILSSSEDLPEISTALETYPCKLVESYWHIYWKYQLSS